MEHPATEPKQHRWERSGFALAAFLLLACSLCPLPSRAEESTDPRELLKQLNSTTLDRTQVYAIRNCLITIRNSCNTRTDTNDLFYQPEYQPF